MLQMGDTVHVGPRYTAPKISAMSYLFRTFSLLIMGDTERPRYTGFRGLSVRGITALQCKEKDPNKLRIMGISAGFGLFHDIGKQIEQQRIQ